MKSSKYIDIAAINQVIGNLYLNPALLNQEDKYHFNEEDFISAFHKITFSCIYNLYNTGVKNFSFEVLSDYFENRPKAKAEFEANKGYEYLLKVKDIANSNTFNYYYNRVKKMSLLRAYEDIGMNLDWLYNPDLALTDCKKLQEQEEWIDNASLEEINSKINYKIDEIKMKYVQDMEDTKDAQLGDGALELLESLKETPSFGYPFYTKYMNTITRGARQGKFYLRSAPTGVGKSRSMVADACYWGCGQIFDLSSNRWITTGAPASCLYIATEQDLEEVTTMAIAFIAGVDEEHILQNSYFVGEWERVVKATQILKNGKVYFVCIPDFSLQDIENIIKKYIREKQITMCCFDYIHSSASILTSTNSGVKNLREDSVLFLLSSKLKDLCVQYGIFILSATQLNAQFQESDTPDQNLLRGSKAIADRLDVGMIMLEVTKEDKEKLQLFCSKNKLPLPNLKISIYKNRQNRFKSDYLWLNANRGACRFDGMFMTDWQYNVLDVDDIKIKVEEENAF